MEERYALLGRVKITHGERASVWGEGQRAEDLSYRHGQSDDLLFH